MKMAGAVGRWFRVNNDNVCLHGVRFIPVILQQLPKCSHVCECAMLAFPKPKKTTKKKKQTKKTVRIMWMVSMRYSVTVERMHSESNHDLLPPHSHTETFSIRQNKTRCSDKFGESFHHISHHEEFTEHRARQLKSKQCVITAQLPKVAGCWYNHNIHKLGKACCWLEAAWISSKLALLDRLSNFALAFCPQLQPFYCRD